MDIPVPFSGDVKSHHLFITGEYIFQNRSDNMTIMGKPCCEKGSVFNTEHLIISCSLLLFFNCWSMFNLISAYWKLIFHCG